MLLNCGIGLGTGLISGLISGWIVTWRFNQKEKSLNWKKALSEDKQIMVRYLDLIQFELNLVKEKIINKKKLETETIQRVLVDEPRTPSIQEDKVTEVSIKHIHSVRKLINEIREDLNNQKQLTERDITSF